MVDTVKKIQWDKVLLRPHMVGEIMTPAKDAAKKAAGEFGDTALKGLFKIYILERFGREQKLDTAAIRKGLGIEDIGIEMINELTGEKYKKNEERVSNEYFSGVIDMFKGKDIRKAVHVRDHKGSWDLFSFIPNAVTEPTMSSVGKIYWFQGQAYCDLTNSKKFILDYTLQDAPVEILMEEKRKLMWKMGVATEENPDYKVAAAEKEFSLMFGDILPQLKHISIEIPRNDTDIEAAQQAAVRSRKWLADFDEMYLDRCKVKAV